MDLRHFLDLASSASQAIAAIGGAGGLLTFYWVNLRLPSRQGDVVDKAAKYLALRESLLNFELAATDDREEHREARLRALAASNRYLQWADREMERLSWEEWTRHLVKEDRLLSRNKVPRHLTRSEQLQWRFCKILSWLFLIPATAVLFSLVWFILRSPQVHSLLPILAGLAYFFAICFVSSYLNLTAARLTLPDKPAPIFLDRL